MALNPITALSEQLQKLINEKGSAAILRDHLALFKDQVVLLEKKNAELVAENTVLKAGKEKVESNLQESQKENEILRSKIQENKQPTEQPTHKNLLDDVKVKVLVRLSKERIVAESTISDELGLAPPVAKFHLEELKAVQMAKRAIAGTMMKPVNGWSLDQEGTRYLIENGLLT